MLSMTSAMSLKNNLVRLSSEHEWEHAVQIICHSVDVEDLEVMATILHTASAKPKSGTQQCIIWQLPREEDNKCSYTEHMRIEAMKGGCAGVRGTQKE